MEKKIEDAQTARFICKKIKMMGFMNINNKKIKLLF